MRNATWIIHINFPIYQPGPLFPVNKNRILIPLCKQQSTADRERHFPSSIRVRETLLNTATQKLPVTPLTNPGLFLHFPVTNHRFFPPRGYFSVHNNSYVLTFNLMVSKSSLKQHSCSLASTFLQLYFFLIVSLPSRF